MNRDVSKNYTLQHISWIIILMMAIFGIIFGAYVNVVDIDPTDFHYLDLLFVVGPAISSAMAFLVYKKYEPGTVYKKTYLALALGLFFIFLGEFTYVVIYGEILGIDPYPSVADVFYFMFYPFALYHLIVNVTYFRRKFDLKTILIAGSISLAIILAYFFLAINTIGIPNFDFYYGFVFISGSALTASIAAVGAIRFRSSVMGTIWLLMMVGILFNATADIWYYYVETFEGYEKFQTTDTFWLLAWMIISYSLYKHHREM